MKERFPFLGSTGCQPVAFGRWPNAMQRKHGCWRKLFAASCREPQTSGLCSSESSSRCLRPIATIFMVCLACPTSAVTLPEVLRTTLETNPAVLQAKAGLEQAAGQRLVFRSIVWPDFDVLVPAGLQYGHRAGESGAKGFAVGRGNLEQTLFNMAVPPSLRRGDIEVLIAQQRLNVAVVEQLHAARLAFYAALYNRSLGSIRNEQRNKLEENVATQKNRFEAGLADRSAFTSATVTAEELVPQVESAHRAYREAQLRLAEAMGIDPVESALPQPEGELEFATMHVDLESETAAALQRRADLKLARLFVRSANEDERIIAADYYPEVAGRVSGEYVPVTGIHRQGSTSKTQDFIGSEIVERAGYTWRVIDNGKVGGAVLKARAA